ncbi:MAG: vitamin B12-dependent ribonucleotide reductase [Christensenellales bacterium]|jgi:ribonucleoside-diphosphate reductase alpha chain
MAFSNNAIKVLQRRYLSKDENGKPTETVDGLFSRVARSIAAPDAAYGGEERVREAEEAFLSVMLEQKFMPNSPTLMNAGKPLGQLSACFVLPVGDSMEEIFDAVKNAALIHKSGGGTGFSFSRIRPAGASVRSTGGIASGPISFMKVFNTATEAVKQGGMRRGANMGILRVDHPDIMEFITCKADNSDITNFNISIGITEAFMRAVRENGEYELIDPSTKKPVGKLRAKDVYDLIVDMSWNNGEPGIIFLDRLNRDNVVPGEGEIESTNPCGEQPLLPYESCNLGSINLEKVLSEQDGTYTIDFEELTRIVDVAVHFLDNVIEANRYPLPQIEETTKKTRKIGLGVMGFADMLFKLKIPYNSEEGIQTAKKVMRFIQARAKMASIELAKQRGGFPLFQQSTLQSGPPMRNATCTTIAPTGTISIICGASSGVEPLFGISFFRNVMDNDQLLEVHPYFSEVAKKRGFYSEELMKKIAQEGTLAHIDEIPEDVKKVFVTAHDISPEFHIRMQAAFQEHTDNAVSKTVNFPSSATRDDVRRVYDLAFDLDCKGVTIYRDGSRDAQVLYTGGQAKQQEGQAGTEAGVIIPRPRPEVTRGMTEKIKIGCGNLYVTVNYDEQGICEVFTNLGRAGGCPSQSEATSRLVSTALRSGMQVDAIIEQLKGIRCHSTLRQKGLRVLSCPDAIGKVLEKVANMQKLEKEMGQNSFAQENAEGGDAHHLEAAKAFGDCPDCGGAVEHEGGCVVCRGCGYSKCG